MALASGTRLGHYDVTALIGEGGMGQVWQATDTQLGRQVALKILPNAFAADPDRLARFQREAQILARLNHPNIAAIYGIEEAEPSTKGTSSGPEVKALVLELVEGPTLADRLAHGAIPLEDALPVATQIAEALEAAHDAGVIHRDLKPANIKVREDGTVKVLDFGLAKATAASPQVDPSLSPTMASAATELGLILGTATYMAPEQARGKPVDRRADIWAFGVVLYEMLTGRRAFDGEDISATLADVIRSEPDWRALPDGLSPSLTTFLKRCLEKDPRDRIRDIGDIRLALGGAFDVIGTARPPDRAARPRRWPLELGGVALVSALLTGAAVWMLARTDPPRRHPVRFDIQMPSDIGRFMELSPDGRQLAFLALDVGGDPRLWVHSLETGLVRSLTDVSDVGAPIFWSPDSLSLGWADRTVGLRTMALSGGLPEVAADTGSFSGATWSPEGVIALSVIDRIMRVQATGGSPVPLTVLDPERNEVSHTWPWFLPDGRHFLYLRSSRVDGESGIYVGSIDEDPGSQDTTRVVASDRQAYFVPAPGSTVGYLLFMRDDILMAQPFDDTRFELTGEASRLAEGVADTGLSAAVSVSQTGTLVYRRDDYPAALVWVDRDGREDGTIMEASGDAPAYPRLSPEGSRVAVVIEGDIWAYDLEGRPPVKLTSDGGYFSPIWTPDGATVIAENTERLFAVPSDGSGGTPEAASPPGHYHPHAWLPDTDQVLAVSLIQSDGVADLVRFAPAAEAEPQPVVQTAAFEGFSASLSFDGRWLAYTADPTGESEIWVRGYPEGSAVRVSPNGGVEPVWSSDGSELFYLEANGMMAVSVDTSDGFDFDAPTRLFEGPFLRFPQPPSYDVASDGRFLMVRPNADPTVSVILEWTALVRAGS